MRANRNSSARSSHGWLTLRLCSAAALAAVCVTDDSSENCHHGACGASVSSTNGMPPSSRVIVASQSTAGPIIGSSWTPISCRISIAVWTPTGWLVGRAHVGLDRVAEAAVVVAVGA